MMMMMRRRCSHCSHNGHNSRTCPNRGVKIFGVLLTDGSIRKSASMGNLSHYADAAAATAPPAPDDGGYASEGFARGNPSSSRERKKGVPWTEEEHRMFLLGLKKVGKGDWRGIARDYVVSRTPTQVASHAQKYFIRQANASRRKRRTSLFDMVPDDPVDEQLFPVFSQELETEGNSLVPAPALDEECESMDSNSNDGEVAVPESEIMQGSFPVMYPAIVAPVYQFPVPVWSGYFAEPLENRTHEIFKPIAIHRKAPLNVDELGGMSKLTLRETVDGENPPSFLSLKLHDGSDRLSAFQATPPASGITVSSGNNVIPDV